MKLFSFLFLILLFFEEFNCAPFLDWSDETKRWRMDVTDCGFRDVYNQELGRQWRLFQRYSQDPPRPTYISDYETKTKEDKLSKKTVDKPLNNTLDKPSNKTLDKPPNKTLDKPSNKTLDKPPTWDDPSGKYLDKPSTNSAESSLEDSSDNAIVRQFDDMPTENPFDDNSNI